MRESAPLINAEELKNRKALIADSPTGKRIKRASKKIHPSEGDQVNNRATYLSDKVIRALAITAERVSFDNGETLIEPAGISTAPALMDPRTSQLFFFESAVNAVATYKIPNIVTEKRQRRVEDLADEHVHIKEGVYPGALFKTREIGGTGAAFERRSSGVQLKQRVRNGLLTPGLERAIVGRNLRSVNPQEVQDLLMEIRAIQCQADLNRLNQANQSWHALMQELKDDTDAKAINNFLSRVEKDSRLRHQTAELLSSRPGRNIHALHEPQSAFYVRANDHRSKIFVKFHGETVGSVRTGNTMLESLAFHPERGIPEGYTFETNDETISIHPFTIAELDRKDQLRVTKDIGALGSDRLLRVGTAYAALMHIKNNGDEPAVIERIRNAFSWFMAA